MDSTQESPETTTTDDQPQLQPDELQHHDSAEQFQPIDPLYRDEELMILSANLVYWVILTTLLGLAIREINKKTKFPYSPMILTTGLLLGAFQNKMGFLGRSTTLMSYMHPHLILYVFIPVLLFESAFNSDWYVFKKVFANIVLLAGPGVCWGAIILGLMFKVVLFYGSDDMTWCQAFTLGAVLSATDPVAVLALLKELGASVRFNTLIEGLFNYIIILREALVNDGTAMVFFLFFRDLSLGKGGSALPVFANLANNIVVGPLIGLVISFFGAFWTRRIVGDDVEVTWLTFVFAYVAFYIAEFSFFHTSGILTIVSLGLFWSAFGKTKIRGHSEHAVHQVWAFVQYLAETLIFFLIGIIVGSVIMREEHILPSDYFRMIVFFFLMILGRYLMIMTFWPLIKLYGYPISKQELIVLVYGGLRGALGLCLSLMVGIDQELPVRFRHLTVFYMASMAALTNLVNGTTCKALMNYLNMGEIPTVRKRVYKTFLEEFIQSSEDKKNELATDQYYSMVDWTEVHRLIGNDKLQDQINHLEGDIRNKEQVYQGSGEKEMHGEVRYRLLRMMKGLHYEKFEHGFCQEDACRLLVESCDISLDKTDEALNVWEQLFVSFTSLRSLQFFFRYKDLAIFGRIAQDQITRHLGFVYDATTTFISVAQAAHSLSEHIPMSGQAVRFVMEELISEINKAELYLGNLNDQFPEILRSIQTKRASHSLLMHQHQFLEESHENGCVDESEFKQLKFDIDGRLVQLENHFFEWSIPSFDQFVMEFPIFASLTKSQVEQIKQNANQKTSHPDEYIYEQGMTCQYLFIITKGNVIDHVGEFEVKKGLGSILSFANVIGDGKCLSTATAKTLCVTTAIKASVFRQLMEENQEFEQKIYIGALDYLIKIYPDLSGPLQDIDERRLLKFLRQKAQFKKHSVHDKIEFMQGGYIFRGEVQSCFQEDNDEEPIKFDDYTFKILFYYHYYVPPSNQEFNVTRDVIAMVFDEDINEVQQEYVEKLGLEQNQNQGVRRQIKLSFQHQHDDVEQ